MFSKYQCLLCRWPFKLNPAIDHCNRVSRLLLKRMLIFLSAELVHDLWKVFTKHWAMIIKGVSELERLGGVENLWKGASVWIKTVGVRGGWGGPVTHDLLPPGPFRAAQWLTPVSFQYWHYYYLHQSVGERGKDRKRPEVLWSRVHQPHANNTPSLLQRQVPSLLSVSLCLPIFSSLIISDNSKHIGGRRGSRRRRDKVRLHPVTNCLLFYINMEGIKLGY